MAVETASWYHCSVQTIGRSANRTAIAAAAYRTATRLHDEELRKSPGIDAAAYRTGTRLNDAQTPDPEVTDYTRRKGVQNWFIVAPENAPGWAYNLERLWNEAQEKDKRINSRVARECVLALPDALGPEEHEQIARDFADYLVERYGVAVTVALHAPSRYGDQRNWHAHIMFTTRRMDEKGFGKKTRELDDKVTGPKEIKRIREAAADILNEYLERAGIDERVDHRSFRDRGIDRAPTGHMGVEASAMERRGEKSAMGDKNREARELNENLDTYDRNIEHYNREFDRIAEELAAIEDEIARESAKAFFGDAFDGIFDDPASKRLAQEYREKGEIGNELDFPGMEEEEELDEPDREGDADDPDEEEPPPDGTPAAYASFPLEGQPDLFDSPTCRRYTRQVREYGEIKEYGLGKKWYDRTVAFWEDATRFAKDTWQKYITNRRDRTASRTEGYKALNDSLDSETDIWQKRITGGKDKDKSPSHDDCEPGNGNF